MHTHETDKALWIAAHHGSLQSQAKLAPGELLTAEEREYAKREVAENADADERDRMRGFNYGPEEGTGYDGAI